MTSDEIRNLLLRQALSLPVFFVLLFGPAGTLDYWPGWLYGILFVLTSAGIGLYLYKRDPHAIARRMHVGPGAEKETSQKIIITLVLIGFALLIALPGFDHRWHWSDVPAWLVILANALVVLGLIGTAVVVRQNSYAASTVRVEAGQPVISTGLYGIVRHPMYSAALLMLGFTPLALGSYWTMLLVIPLIGVLAWRLLDEERVLKRDLPGYIEYCRQVRHHLIPGVW